MKISGLENYSLYDNLISWIAWVYRHVYTRALTRVQLDSSHEGISNPA